MIVKTSCSVYKGTAILRLYILFPRPCWFVMYFETIDCSEEFVIYTSTLSKKFREAIIMDNNEATYAYIVK